MCPPLIAAIPMIGSYLATAGVAATAAGGVATAGTVLGMTTTTAMSVLSIASAAAGLYGQKVTAKAQTEQIATQAANEREEIGAASEEEIGDRIKASRKRRASARVAAGESGALGASFAASLNQSLSDQNLDIAKISKQQGFAIRGVDDRAATALAGIRSPSALEAGLQIAGAGASGYRAGLGISDQSSAQSKFEPYVPPPLEGE